MMSDKRIKDFHKQYMDNCSCTIASIKVNQHEIFERMTESYSFE